MRILPLSAVKAKLSELVDVVDRRDESITIWSLRAGRHRIISRPDHAGAEIVAFGPRRTMPYSGLSVTTA